MSGCPGWNTWNSARRSSRHEDRGVADLDDAKARIADGIERADEDDLSIAGEFNSDLRSFVVDSISLWGGRPFSDERTARVAESAGTTSDLDAITEAMKDELHAWHMARVAASKGGYPMPGETQGGVSSRVIGSGIPGKVRAGWSVVGGPVPDTGEPRDTQTGDSKRDATPKLGGFRWSRPFRPAPTSRPQPAASQFDRSASNGKARAPT